MLSRALAHIFLSACAVFGLTSCASANEAAAPVTVTVASTVTTTVTAEAPSEETATANEASSDAAESAASSGTVGNTGEAVINDGISVTVTKARIVKSILMNRSGYDANSDYGKFTAEKPSKDGKFLEVQTVIKNVGSSSIDLTCDWPLEILSVDTQDREFDPIDDLYLIKNNPGCNDKLQPGFKDQITYVFLVPEDATIKGLYFRDTTETSSEFSGIRFDPDLK